MITEGTIRSAPALTVVKVLRERGLDPTPILASVGLSATTIEHPDAPIQFAALGRLVLAAVEATGCEHLGLLVGQSAGTAMMGAVGLAARNAPDVRSALRLAAQYLSVHDRGGVAELEIGHDVVKLGYRLVHPGSPGGEIITDGAMVVTYRLVEALCGQAWRPLETTMARRRPAEPQPYHAQFGNRLRFEAGESAVVFSAKWLEQSVGGADPELQRILLGVIEGMRQPPARDLRDDVRHAMAARVGHNDVLRDTVAETLGMSSSTLHRRLADLGTSYRDLLEEVRTELATRLLLNGGLRIGQVAMLLGYSEASAFTRSFRRRFGCGPAEWRAAQRVAKPRQ